jgi:hypothetical protein
MKLLRRQRAQAVSVAIDRSSLHPGETASVTAEIASALENVRSAQVDLGYENVFAYKWIGDAQASEALKSADLLLGNHSTAGDTRNTTEWVSVARHELLVGPSGELGPGEHHIDVPLPADAPASSEGLARWMVRLAVDREHAGDEEAEATFRVLSAAPSISPEQLEFEHEKGESSDVDIRLGSAGAPVGGTVKGTVVITPKGEVPGAKVTVFLDRAIVSHPTDKVSAGRTLSWKAREVAAKRCELSAGVATELPFELKVPDDAEPTAVAVHSSASWFVSAMVDYGWTGPSNEVVRRAVVLYSKPDA